MNKIRPHFGCDCNACRRAAGTKAGQYIHRTAERQFRHSNKIALTRDPWGYEVILVGTAYIA
jgi:hypothetical protein